MATFAPEYEQGNNAKGSMFWDDLIEMAAKKENKSKKKVILPEAHSCILITTLWADEELHISRNAWKV